MMQCLILFSAVLIQCSWGYALLKDAVTIITPDTKHSVMEQSKVLLCDKDNCWSGVKMITDNCSPRPDGVGVFAYEDSAGHRYRRFLPPLPPLPPLKPLSPFEPFRSLPPLPPLPHPSSSFSRLPPLPPMNNLGDAIFNNIENQQRAAYEAAQNSFGAFNAFPYIPYIPNFNFRFPPNDQFNYFGPSNPGFAQMSGINSAFASGAVGPGYRHQVAAINPANPQAPNVDVSSQYPVDRNSLDNRFYSVSSSSYASSVDNNGHTQGQRGAETVINDNGKITRYSVRN